MVRKAFREVLICLLNPELVSLLFIASSSLNLTNFYRNFFITSFHSFLGDILSFDKTVKIKQILFIIGTTQLGLYPHHPISLSFLHISGCALISHNFSF